VFQEDKDMAIQSAGSRLGVKGSSEMDSGLTSFYQMELSFGNPTSGRDSNHSTNDSTVLTVRQMNAGVKGDFGKVIIGRFTNPYVATYTADIFERESGPYQLAPYRIGNAVAYTTPSFGGFSATAGVIGEGEGDDSTYEDVDGYVLQAGGSFGPVSVNVAYMETDYEVGATATEEETELASIGLAYNANNVYVGLGYEEDDVSSTDVIDFTARYTVGKTAFGLGYAKLEGAGSIENDRAMVGVYHDLGGSADTYLEVASHDATSSTGVDSDFNRVTLGYRVKF
jgi:predicted porin